MKTKVRQVTSTVPKALYNETKGELESLYKKFEDLFHENRDLRLSESQQKDEIKFLKEQVSKVNHACDVWHEKFIAKDKELSHSNEVIMALNNQIEKLTSDNARLLDEIDTLEYDNKELREENTGLQEDRDYFATLAEDYRSRCREANEKLRSYEGISNLISNLMR